MFVIIQRATRNQLPTCEQAAFTRLQSLSVDERNELLRALQLIKPDRRGFFDGVVPRLDDLWQDPNLMLEVVPEIMKRAASEHVSYLELQLDPTSLHDAAGHAIPPELFVERLKNRLAFSDTANTGVTVRFQVAAYRYASNPYAELSNAFQFVDKHRDLWVGVNLLGEEGRAGGELSRFAPALRELSARYDIPIALHAGELDVRGRQVHEAATLGARRIGHALNLLSDPDTMRSVRSRNIAIETSLVSNMLLQYTPDLSRHPFPVYLRFGIPICLNTDDPGAWDGTLTDEFFLATTLYHLRWNEIVTLSESSIQYAFVDKEAKTRLLTRLHNDLSAFAQRTFRERAASKLTEANVSGVAWRYLRLGR